MHIFSPKWMYFFAFMFALAATIPFIYSEVKGRKKFFVTMLLFLVSIVYIIIPYNAALLKPMVVSGNAIKLCEKSCAMLRKGTYLESFPLGQIAHNTAVPSNPFFAKGVMLYETGKHDSAIMQYDMALNKVNKNYPLNDGVSSCKRSYYRGIIHWNLGFAYQAMEDKVNAIEKFKASKMDYDDYNAYFSSLGKKEKELLRQSFGENLKSVTWTYYNWGMLEEDFKTKERILNEARLNWGTWDDIVFYCLLIVYREQFNLTKDKKIKQNMITNIENLKEQANDIIDSAGEGTIKKKKFTEFVTRANEELLEINAVMKYNFSE